MVEYGLILGLISIVAIAALTATVWTDQDSPRNSIRRSRKCFFYIEFTCPDIRFNSSSFGKSCFHVTGIKKPLPYLSRKRFSKTKA